MSSFLSKEKTKESYWTKISTEPIGTQRQKRYAVDNFTRFVNENYEGKTINDVIEEIQNLKRTDEENHEQILYEMLQDWINWNEKRGLGNYTIRVAFSNLRKFFKSHAEQSMKPINVEILMGHSTGISDSYYRPNENELLKDYLNAIPELTISKENRVKNDKEKLRTHGSDIEFLKEEIRRIKLKNEVAEALKQGIAEWSEENNYISNLSHIAKTDLRNSKGLDEMVEHLLKEHNGNIDGLKQSFAKAKIRLVDD